MQLEEAERQNRAALADAPYHLQVEVTALLFPTQADHAAGRHAGKIRGKVVSVFRSSGAALAPGDEVALVLPNCVSAAWSQYALIGGWNVFEEDLEGVKYFEALLEADLSVACALLQPLDAPTVQPVLDDFALF